MLSLFKSALVGLANTGRSTGLQGVLQSHRKVLSAGMKTYEVPPDYSEVVLPERPKLKFLNKVPNFKKARKEMKKLRDIQGPAQTANTFTKGQYGIVALGGATSTSYLIILLSSGAGRGYLHFLSNHPPLLRRWAGLPPLLIQSSASPQALGGATSTSYSINLLSSGAGRGYCHFLSNHLPLLRCWAGLPPLLIQSSASPQALGGATSTSYPIILLSSGAGRGYPHFLSNHPPLLRCWEGLPPLI
ncbi:uncharacterized protein LOC109877029 isoform X2 [Oncorhynchus kisutch]|uniref:uncharacterized protein LOC116352748 isoform X2 n=1 Tax=Oncorhynchus kisutch TaxID=8019 RepID=UPI0012DDF799|nr:uncharacterized protein LOC116352748 isoform X2 [Oncorhynchus kisutch]XP_031672131.1 uncharacterized protein LOC109877029 isoform X2 [Oncorhynchus kisutch]